MPKNVLNVMKEFLKYIENELLICLAENQPNNFVLT